MKRTTLSLILAVAFASAAAAAPTPEQECDAAKLNALRKRGFCLEGERRKEVLGTAPDPAKCQEKFATAMTKADDAAAKQGSACRWLNNGDGTVTDLNSGLQWELETDDASIHDWLYQFLWNTTLFGELPNGSAFTVFLGVLNGGTSADGSTTAGCFAGHYDWRLPTINELAGIVDLTAPGCSGGSPCTSIPGFTHAVSYWSATTHADDPQKAWRVSFYDGSLYSPYKGNGFAVRAVRGGLT